MLSDAATLIAVEPENALEHSLANALKESLRLTRVAGNHLAHLKISQSENPDGENTK